MPRPKQPKVEIKRTTTSLGWAYRIYVNGHYMGTGLTQASARDAARRMVERWHEASSIARLP
jgi:hypothetical protein